MSQRADHDVTEPSPIRVAQRGAIRVLPLLTGIAPFGFAVGAAGSASDLSPAAAWSSAILVYGGSIQLVVLQLVESGAAPAVVAVAALLAAVPRCLFAVTIAPAWRGTSRSARALASYLLVEPVYAVSVTESTGPNSPRLDRALYLGAGVTVLATWLVVTGLGAIIGGGLPNALGLELVVPVMMLGLAFGSERTPSAWLSAVVAGILSLALSGLPLRIGFVVAVAAGVAVSLLPERVAER